ncbi:MLO protein homolog 1-like [Carica papaya]|uniref:MLO protein homolog 1-like n=1 Tax=Carica papaya TaxID=3649 RepID=UPI000B8CDBB9|nr:MLO protein homolog 1-like [Carica papaya]
MAAGGVGDRTLQETPTWAVAAVCAVLVMVSIIIEHSIFHLAKLFQKRQKKAMSEALEKIKAELMLLGFISLLLSVSTKFISKICLPRHLENFMLPCKPSSDEKKIDDDHNDRRKLLWFTQHRVLAAASSGDDYCSTKDKLPLISQTGLHQLHIFIFVLAVFHVLYSFITMALAQAKVKKWKAWESETTSLEYEFTNDPSRFRFTHQTSFVKRHSGLSTIAGVRWMVAFFRQFFRSVTKVDYLTMRHGFISAHFAPNTKFNFHKYIKRSMEDDFKVVVGISIPLWVFAVVFLLLNVYSWHVLITLFSFVPLIILIIIGTKLEHVIMEMAQEIQDRTTIVRGAPVVEPNNKYFWFNRPHWILFFIHYILFQNAFQMAYFLYVSIEFGLKSCFNENLVSALTRVVLGVLIQIICSYSTFPLYALVTQMGTHMKKAIFEEQTSRALKKWQKAAKEKRKLRKAGDNSSMNLSGENTPSQGTSPLHLLHKHMTRSSTQPDIESVMSSPRSPYVSDTDLSDLDEPTPARFLHQKPDDQSADFSFVKANK